MNQTSDSQLVRADNGKTITTKRFPSIQGMETFTFIWFGQIISLLGSSLTGFALSIWVYQQTDSVTQFSLPLLSAAIPSILIGPIAGVYVDRWSRRWTMIISDFCAGLCTLLVAWLYINGSLELWHICLTNAFSSILSTFQGLAYSASVTFLVPKDKLARASGITYTGQAISSLAAPTLAVTLLAIIQLQGIIILDFFTLLLALLTLVIVKFPELTVKKEEHTEQESFLDKLTYGWKYFLQRPGLLGLLVLVALCNFLVGATQVLDTPLILSFASVTTLGIVVSCANAGMVIGGLIMTIWGGWQNQMTTVFISMLAIGLSVIFVGLRPSAILLASANFSLLLAIPIVNSAIQAIYQCKVAPEVQGRVFAFRKSVALATLPLSYFIAGPLADRFFEPLMTQDSFIARSIGQVIGTGPGRGIGLMFICMGILTILMTSIAYFFPSLRNLEDELPDAIIDGQ